MEIRDDRDIYGAFARIRADDPDIIFDDRKLPFSKRVIAASLITTIERLRSGEWKPIHPAYGMDKAKEIQGLESFLVMLDDYQRIDLEDRDAVAKINRLSVHALLTDKQHAALLPIFAKYQKRSTDDGA